MLPPKLSKLTITVAPASRVQGLAVRWDGSRGDRRDRQRGAPTCADGVKNGEETGKDCGGGRCDPCPDGEGCTAGSDCASTVCTGGMCVAAP